MTDDIQLQPDRSTITQYRDLLSVSEILAAQRDLPSLFNILAWQLQTLAEFDAVITVLYDPAHDLLRIQKHDARLTEKAQATAELRLDASSSDWVSMTQQPLI